VPRRSSGRRLEIRLAPWAAAAILLAVLAPAATAKPTPLPGVVTAGGSVRCFYVPARPAHLLCDVRTPAYAQHEQDACMARSGLDWHGWELTATRPASTVCAGGILYNSNRNVPAYRRLAAGATWRFAAFTCAARPDGLTCTTSGGHGLVLSRTSWRGW
jgi:hypothetical protein